MSFGDLRISTGTAQSVSKPRETASQNQNLPYSLVDYALFVRLQLKKKKEK